MIRILLIVMAIAAVTVSCDIAEIDFHGKEATASVQVSIEGLHETRTRSSVGGTDAIQAFENSMNNMTLFQFSADGTLYRSYYYPSLKGNLTIQGRSGREYVFRAVMNMGDVSGWLSTGASIDALSRMAYEYGGLPDVLSACPMSCLDARMAMSARGGVLNLVFTRLMSRYDLRIDRSHLSHGDFEVISLRLRQAPVFVRPLAGSSLAADIDEVEDGDYATESDISSLRNGSFVPFYILENAQGTLLDGNKDPWSKVPSSITGRSGVCTYVEVKGTYHDKSGKMNATHTYRMFLGEDNTSNFDIIRGTHHDLTLSLSDDAFLRASWKAERHIINDDRTLAFSPDRYELRYGEDKLVTLLGDDGCSFALSSELSAAGVFFDPKTMTLSSTQKLSADIQGTLVAISWDRLLTATAYVTALRYRQEFNLICICDFQWDYDEDQVGDVTQNTLTEWVYFLAVTPEGTSLPCRFRIIAVR